RRQRRAPCTASCSLFEWSRGHPELHSFPTRRSSDLEEGHRGGAPRKWSKSSTRVLGRRPGWRWPDRLATYRLSTSPACRRSAAADRKSTPLNSSHVKISYAVFCLKQKMI